MATYNLTAGNDVLTGTASADTFDGYNSDDGSGEAGGTDTLNGGAGNDVFLLNFGSAGTINGEADTDTVRLLGWNLGTTTFSAVEVLDGGTDTFDGGAGNDILEIHDSSGTFNGGIGNDIFKISYSTGTVDGGAGTDTVISEGLGAISYSNMEILDLTSGRITASIAQLYSFAKIINSAEPFSTMAFQLSGMGGTIDFLGTDTRACDLCQCQRQHRHRHQFRRLALWQRIRRHSERRRGRR
jgi:Ca2+-binding RTX toxin-like protein